MDLLGGVVIRGLAREAEEEWFGDGGGRGRDGVVIFLTEFRLSRVGTRLQVGWRTGRPLNLGTVGAIETPTVTLDSEVHMIVTSFVQYVMFCGCVLSQLNLET